MAEQVSNTNTSLRAAICAKQSFDSSQQDLRSMKSEETPLLYPGFLMILPGVSDEASQRDKLLQGQDTVTLTLLPATIKRLGCWKQKPQDLQPTPRVRKALPQPPATPCRGFGAFSPR